MSEYPRKLLDAVAQTIIEAHYPGQAGVSYHRLAHQVLDVVRAFDASHGKSQKFGCCPRCCDPVEHVRCFDPECPTVARVEAVASDEKGER